MRFILRHPVIWAYWLRIKLLEHKLGKINAKAAKTKEKIKVYGLICEEFAKLERINNSFILTGK